MRKILLLVLCCTIAVTTKINAQKIATFDVDLSKATNGLEVPVSTDLDAITFLSDSALNLVEVKGNKRNPVPFQIR